MHFMFMAVAAIHVFRAAQVAIELLKLTEDHGLDSWVNPCLDKQLFSIAGVRKNERMGYCSGLP